MQQAQLEIHMSTSFDPSTLTGGGAATQSRKPSARFQAERLFVQVEKYETPSDNFHFAVGTRLDTGEPVRVRLNSVAERAADRPNASIETITGQYQTNDKHRDSMADKSKAGIKLLSFDEAMPLGKNADGVAEFRAHWSNTMSTEPTAEPLIGVAHIKLSEAFQDKEGKSVKAQAHVDLLREAAVVDKDNVDQAMLKALATKDDQGRAVDPMMIMRVFYNDPKSGDLVQAAAATIFPDRGFTEVFDQATGGNKQVPHKADAETSLNSLLSGKPGFAPLDDEYRHVVRAVVAGIKGEPLPAPVTDDPRVVSKAEGYYNGAKDGHFVVEVVAAERIDFGKKTRTSYLEIKDQPQMAAYNIVEPQGDNKLVSKGYTETVLAIERHADGEPYAVFASPKQQWVRDSMVKMKEIGPGVLPQMDLRGPEKAHRQEDDGPSPT
jgi:hypothetical protein